MAHYKRKKPRISPSRGYSRNGLKHRLGDRHHKFAWIDNWPKYWDVLMHTKPSRRKQRKLEVAVMKGEDPDNMTWPEGRKPHIYYW
jgi:hypothetical protein